MSRTLLRAASVFAVGAFAACAPAAQVEAPAPPTTAPPAAPAAEFPTTAPQPGPAASLTLPAPERRTLSNGLEVIYVRQGTLPVVHATLVSRGGQSDDPARWPGLAAFTAGMLDEGAAGRDALELAADLSQLGASLSTSAGSDAAYVNLHVLRTRLPDALALMADVAARPDFPTAELERIRQEELTDLARARDEARVIAGNAFASLVYGEDHPYGRITTTESISSLERDHLRAFHLAFYRPGTSTLVLVGDVDADALHPVVEEAFGGWDRGSPPAEPRPVETPEIGETAIYLIDKPEAAQSEIRIGHPGISRDHPDYFPLVVLNTILGGSFTSRLNTNLRETHGYTYGASSSFSMRRGAGPFMAGAAVITAKTDSAVIEFFHELNRIREESVPADELARAKSYVALGLPRRFETTQGVAMQIADLETYDQSIDFYNDYVERVMAVTAEDVRRVANEQVRPDRAVVVVVGDRESIETGLRALGIGPVEIRETPEFVR